MGACSSIGIGSEQDLTWYPRMPVAGICRTTYDESGQPMMDVPLLGSCKDKPFGPESLPDGRLAITFRAKRGGNTNDVNEKALATEVKILGRLMAEDHKDDVGRQRIIELIRSSLSQPVSMTLELVEPFGFDLYSLVEKYALANATMSMSVMGHLMYQLCEALHYLQTFSVVHGDLKPENVLITRECNVKVIDFGTAAIVGESAQWPNNINVAPEVRGKKAKAGFPQDLFSMGHIIFKGFRSAIAMLPAKMGSTAEKLMKPSVADRMHLGQLWNEDWIKQPDSVEHFAQMPQKGCKLTLMSGFAVHVDESLVGRAESTIGQLAFMKDGGAQVLFVDRRGRESPPPETIVRIPQFQTNIASGDWLYLGLNQEHEDKDRYGFRHKLEAARSISNKGMDVKYFPSWLTFDEVAIPAHAHGYALGDMPKDEDAHYQGRDPRVKGYLNLRRRFQINLAGIMRTNTKPKWFVGPEYILQEGDIGLLARVVEADGSSSPSHPKDVLQLFTSEELFKKRMEATL